MSTGTYGSGYSSVLLGSGPVLVTRYASAYGVQRERDQESVEGGFGDDSKNLEKIHGGRVMVWRGEVGRWES
ncbi:hypothetical protein Tco_1464844 [Tanacetum coccineum]